jgi:hypothetical protein
LPGPVLPAANISGRFGPPIEKPRDGNRENLDICCRMLATARAGNNVYVMWACCCATRFAVIGAASI